MMMSEWRMLLAPESLQGAVATGLDYTFTATNAQLARQHRL